MKPTVTPWTDHTFKLAGGTPDNDLPVTTYDEEDGGPCFGSTWVPSYEERLAIAGGATIELIVWGTEHPPVAIRLADYKPPLMPQPTPIEVDIRIDGEAVQRAIEDG